MEKKYSLILIVIFMIFSGCNQSDNSNTSLSVCTEGTFWDEGCNKCNCLNNEVVCTNNICNSSNDNNSFLNQFNENLNTVKFNSNLTDNEKHYLNYYQNKYINSRIYFMKTNYFNCDNCSEMYYKKDREILKIKILNGEVMQESIIQNELNLYIADENMCTLFQGTWNTCPKVCPTDEVICQTQCAPAKCEFDNSKIVLKKIDETCGGLTMGDCEYGLTCYYENKEDEFGICIKK